jgi:EAL domain-containing protein (putative c-di-GMP-specific phosphodiesterase class I)
VETAEQLADLAAMGCDFAQGYYFHRPVSAEQIAELLRAQRDKTPAEALLVA